MNTEVFLKKTTFKFMFVHVGKSNFVFLKIPFIVLIFWLTNKESDFLRIFFLWSRWCVYLPSWNLQNK